MTSYGSVQGVEAVNAHRIGGYSYATVPTVGQVDAFLADGYAKINVALAIAGYTVPVTDTAATCYDCLARLNNLFAAACAEQATAVSTGGPESEARSAVLFQQYRDELKELLAGDLSKAGLASTTTATGGNRYVRSRELRRRDGYAHRFDAANTEYGSTAEE